MSYKIKHSSQVLKKIKIFKNREMSNAYTYDVPTSIINYLYNLIVMYENPLAVTYENNNTYVLMDMNKFNPKLQDPRMRFLFYVIDNFATIIFYTVNMGFNNTLTSLEPVVNKYEVPALTMRIQYYFVSNSSRYLLNYNVTNINKLNQQKIAIANLNNLSGVNYILWGNFFISFLLFKDGTFNSDGSQNKRFCLGQTAYFNLKSQQWDSSKILYDIENGTLVGLVNEKPIFGFNSKDYFYFNYQYFIPDHPDNTLLIGGKKCFIYQKTGPETAIICKANELQYQAKYTKADLLLFVPLDQFYKIRCNKFGGYIYLYGFEGLNNLDNFYTVAQLAAFNQEFETMFFVQYTSKYTQIILPEQPFFDYDGLIMWRVVIGTNVEFIIYQPTFQNFLNLHSTLLQGVNDLIFN